MTQVRFIPIAVEGGKIIENKGKTNVKSIKMFLLQCSGVESYDSSLEYEDTFVEYFKKPAKDDQKNHRKR